MSISTIVTGISAVETMKMNVHIVLHAVSVIALVSLFFFREENSNCNHSSSSAEHRKLRFEIGGIPFLQETPDNIVKSSFESTPIPDIVKPWAKKLIPSVEDITKFPSGVAVPDTTTTKVPKLFQDMLRTQASIDENIATKYPALEAVAALEGSVGWDPVVSDFKNNQLLKDMWVEGVGSTHPGDMTGTKEAMLKQLLGDTHLTELMDIVIPSIRDLDFLNNWREFIEGFHIILIQDGDPAKVLKIPDWADFELYNRPDIERILGEDAWIISQKDASIRNFGFLASKKRFVWSVDDDCFPAKNHRGKFVNALLEHALNLLTPSTPYFFNTVYDPYQNGVDFVRGYPFSLRAGIRTAVSHGLWMNNYDYDAPTQLLKVHEKNDNYADVVLTVPYRLYYPLCSMNVAFDRELIGPALMQGLMGIGQPWGRYDDMFSGWASKIVADHLRLGTKSGAPYIHHNKASNPFRNLEKEYKGLQWQEEVIRFFDATTLSESSNTASLAYVELANKIEAELGYLSPTFARLAQAMRLWTGYWNKRLENKLEMTPSRKSESKLSLSNIVPHKLWAPLYGVDSAKPPSNLYNLPPCASKLKVFIYDLPEKYNIELLNAVDQHFRDELSCPYARGPCAETKSPPLPKYKMFGGEISMLSKFLLLPQTTDPAEADLFIVPWFSVLGDKVAKEGSLRPLKKHLAHYNNYSSKHVFLSSRDRWMIPRDCFGDSFLLTYGPKLRESKREIVIPPNGE